MNELINLGNGQFVKVTMLKGEKGSNIATITKTGTSGLVDTYTVTLTDGSTTTFNVTNGSSIESIEKTGTVGLVDIYTITLTNGETSTFEVTNGNAENLQDAFQASQCAIKAGVSQVTFTNLGDAYITYIPNSECVENAVVVVGFDNGSMYKGTMNYSSALGKWGLSNVELIQGSDVPSTWDAGYGNDSVGTRAFRTGTDFVYSNGIGIALSTSSDVVSYYCVLSSGRVSDNYLQKQINQINSDLSNKQDKLTNPLTQSDVINNLTSTDTNKPLSANQGKALNDAMVKQYINWTSSGTFTSQNIVSVSYALKKNNNLVDFRLTANNGIAMSANVEDEIGTFAVNFRPPHTIWVLAKIEVSGKKYVGSLTVFADGRSFLSTPIALPQGTGTISISCMFVV